MKIYFPLLFALMAFFFLYLGGKVVVGKRPVFLSARYFFAFMVLAFSPQFFIAFRNFPDGIHWSSYLTYLQPLLILCLLVYFWFQMKGYMVLGVTDDSFRKALHASLEKNGLPFEEELSCVTLTSLDTKLHVALQSWVGAGQIKMGKEAGRGLLPKIVSGMEEFFESDGSKPHLVTSVFYIIIGVSLLVCAGVFYTVFDKLS